MCKRTYQDQAPKACRGIYFANVLASFAPPLRHYGMPRESTFHLFSLLTAVDAVEENRDVKAK
jgi:hypothetical protein